MQGGWRGSPTVDSGHLLLALVDLNQFYLQRQSPRLFELFDWLVELEKIDLLEFDLRVRGSTCAPDLRGKDLVRKNCSSNSVRLSVRAASFSMRLTGVACRGWGRACAARERRRAKRPEV
jgi:hypothetical protein